MHIAEALRSQSVINTEMCDWCFFPIVLNVSTNIFKVLFTFYPYSTSQCEAAPAEGSKATRESWMWSET